MKLQPTEKPTLQQIRQQAKTPDGQKITRQLIAEKEAAFRTNKAFRDKAAPGRQEALEEIAGLYDIAYPAETAEA